MRAFVGIRTDPEMGQRISEVQSQLKQSLTGIRWVAPENFHFTLKFLGAVEEHKVGAIASALQSALHGVPRFSIAGRGIGAFPDIRRPRVLWAGLEGEGLEPLADRVELALEPIGFAREERGFKAHLTIGRWRHFDARSEGLEEAIGRWRGCDFGTSLVQEVVLFQSVLRPEGADYSPLGVFPLGVE